MTRYNFAELTDHDFENLIADLLQREFGVSLEVFTPGRDGGIDLRYLGVGPGRELIVQCKRYKESGFAALSSSVRSSEKEKIRALNPGRYILATSANLTPGNKAELAGQLCPWLLSEADIFGRDDILALLRKYPAVEKSHIKLWLTSAEVLESVLHSDIRNRTDATVDQIQGMLRIWVPNESYADATHLLDTFGICVISGPPGVGKSLLAEVLLSAYGAIGYEPIVIGEDIAEAFRVFNAEREQVFLFDDFLGRVHLETSPLRRNADSDIVRFFAMVRSAPNKRLVLTTREYILFDAIQRHERLEKAQFPDLTYVLNMARYSRPIRAEILYNHLFYSHLPQEAINDVLEDRKYWGIIDHTNYSPRLIEHVVNLELDWTHTSFGNLFMESLNNPSQLWLRIFENLPENSRTVLLAMLTMNRDVAMSHLELVARAAVGFSPLDSVAFEQALRGLEGTFVSIRQAIRPREGVGFEERIVSLSNPSIVDFLWAWLDTRRTILGRMFKRSVMFQQRMRIVTSPLSLTQDKRTFVSTLGLTLVETVTGLLEFLDDPPNLDSREFTLRVIVEERNRIGDTPALRLCRILEFLQDVSLDDETKRLLVGEILRRSRSWLASQPRKADVLTLLKQLEGMGMLGDDSRDEVVTNAKTLFMQDVADLDDADLLGDVFTLFESEFSPAERVECAASVREVLRNFEDELDAAEEPDHIEGIAGAVENLGAIFQIPVERYLKDADRRYEYLSEHKGEREPDWDSDHYRGGGASALTEVDAMFDSLRDRTVD